MKKFIICFLLIAFCFSTLFAYSYPATLKELLEQYKNEGYELRLVTNVSPNMITSATFVGTLILVQDDYIFLNRRTGRKLLLLLFKPKIL